MSEPAPMHTEAPSPTRQRHGWIWIVVLGLILVTVVVQGIRIIRSAPDAGAAGGPPGGAPSGLPPAAVIVVPLGSETARDEARVTGALRAVSRSEVAAREAGAVQLVSFDEGRLVTGGESLVKLDDRRSAAMHAEATARLTAAESLIQQREAELQRARTDREMKATLLEQRAISKSEILDAESAVAVFSAQLEAAKNALAEARSRVDFLSVQLEDMEIKAPFDGLIADRLVEPGEWVNPGQVVASLVSTDPIEAWLRVPERYLAEISSRPEGVTVKVSSTGEEIRPKALRVVPDVDPRSQLFTVIASLANPDTRLAPGQSVTGAVAVGSTEDLRVVPVDALLRTRMGDFVFLTEAGEGPLPTARRVAVNVRFEREGRVYLSPGPDLGEDALVVVEGNDRLLPGQPLLVKHREPEPLPEPPRS